jgi:hypothetical protein
METQTSHSFSASEVHFIEEALQALAPFREDSGSITVRREAVFRVRTNLHPTVMGVYVPPTRTAVLFDRAFAGPGSVMPLTAPECIRAVLAPAMLDDAPLRARWCKLLGVAEDAPAAAAIIEAHTVADLLAQPEAEPLALERLGPETALALALAWESFRSRWFRKRCPEIATFVGSLRSSRPGPLRA